jgi:hypothetical protein
MQALDTIFATISDFSKTMGILHNDFLGLVRRDIGRFIELTDDLYGQMQWQAWSVVGISAVGASLAVVGSLIPKGADPAAALNNPRLGANDGIGDTVSNTLKWIGEQLKNNDFLKTTCKSAAKFFNGIAPAADTWFRSQTTKLEANRELMRVCFQEGQQEKNSFSQETRKAQDTALNILQSKSKGN